VASGLLAITRTLGQTTGIAVLGALWAGRVTQHLGYSLAGGATTAPVEVQVAALHDTFLFVVALVGLALLLGLWALTQERRGKRAAEWAVKPHQQQ
jgi:hypothetical protein